jgi:polysaccharide biosynthesis/export protein
MWSRGALFCLLLIGLAGCTGRGSLAPAGSAAYAIVPPSVPGGVAPEYRIGPLDVLALRVFQEPDFTNEQMPVNAEGQVFVPLIGSVDAGDKTAKELADLIAQRLDERYLVKPQVSVNIVSAYRQRVVVDGEVKKSGIYAFQGRSTLVQAIAMAEGTSEFARLDEVLVFRTIDGKSLVARFDLGAIRNGTAADPEVLPSDTVVVGFSSARRLMRDALVSLPALAGVFVALVR